MKKLLMTMAVVGVLCGCGTLYKGIVTITEVRDRAMKELAQLNKAGKISAQTDARIAQADLAYRQAAETAEKALIAYKEFGSKDQYMAALQAVKAAVFNIIDILVPLTTQTNARQLQSDLVDAVKL